MSSSTGPRLPDSIRAFDGIGDTEFPKEFRIIGTNLECFQSVFVVTVPGF